MRLEEALPLIEAAFSEGAPFRFFQRGKSMLPMLREGIDSVQLVSPSVKAPKKGDVIFYRRDSGEFILHRIVAASSGGKRFDTCGDNQTIPERNVKAESVIGVLEGYYKGEKWVAADDKDYKKYVRAQMLKIKLKYLRYSAIKFLRK